MRKLKLQIQLTIDGFIAGTSGEMDWMTMDWSEDLKEYVRKLTDPVDTILLGKNLAQGFIPYWTEAYHNPEKIEEGAKILFETPKIVFTKTLTPADPEVSSWQNTRLSSGPLKETLHTLKKANGGDMIVYGGGQFVSSLIKEKLIDELHLFINPAIIGQGMQIFQDIHAKQNFKLLDSNQFECGIMVLTYKPI